MDIKNYILEAFHLIDSYYGLMNLVKNDSTHYISTTFSLDDYKNVLLNNKLIVNQLLNIPTTFNDINILCKYDENTLCITILNDLGSRTYNLVLNNEIKQSIANLFNDNFNAYKEDAIDYYKQQIINIICSFQVLNYVDNELNDIIHQLSFSNWNQCRTNALKKINSMSTIKYKMMECHRKETYYKLKTIMDDQYTFKEKVRIKLSLMKCIINDINSYFGKNIIDKNGFLIGNELTQKFEDKIIELIQNYEIHGNDYYNCLEVNDYNPFSLFNNGNKCIFFTKKSEYIFSEYSFHNSLTLSKFPLNFSAYRYDNLSKLNMIDIRNIVYNEYVRDIFYNENN